MKKLLVLFTALFALMVLGCKNAEDSTDDEIAKKGPTLEDKLIKLSDT